MTDVAVLLLAVALAAILRVMWTRCLLAQCRWLHLFNVPHGGLEPVDSRFGVYQCARCKTVSIGADRYRQQDTGPSGVEK